MAFRIATTSLEGGLSSGRVDACDVQRVPLPVGLIVSPRDLTEAVFDVQRVPGVVRLLFGVRQLLVPIIGVPRTAGNPFRVREVRENQALIVTQERHLTFWCSVGEVEGTAEVATAVALHGWRGRLYWMPVSLLHPIITRAMMRRAVRDLAISVPPA